MKISEILFRGKTESGDWAYGYYVFVPKRTGTFGQTISQADFDRHYILTMKYNFAKEINPETVGQYTGLTDKNGKKIFEGDYWLDTDGDYLVYVVEFREGQFGFACYGWQGVLMPYGFDEDAGGFGEIDFSPMNDFNIDLIEIEGNIHDNPELLKGGEG